MFFDQFLQDYFAECAEHLAGIRRALLELDALEGRTAPDAVHVQALFRGLHTLKGLSGMVGLISAERLAHDLEEGLRGWRDSSRPFSPALVQALFRGIDLLEACIAAKRDATDPPEVSEYLAGLQEVLAQNGDPGAAAQAPVAEPVPPRTLYRVAFTPSRELADRGVGVETVRARLGALGQIRSAVPRVGATGGIAFEFLLEADPGKAPDEAWEADEMRWELEEVPAAVEPQPARTRGTSAGDPFRLATGNVVRVDLGRLDELMRMVGELVVSRARLHDAVAQLPGAGKGAEWEAVQESTTLLERQLRALREGVMRMRLVPVGEVFERMRFAVRELARESGKRVNLELHGQETEIDKMLVERMLEPLLHLVRNAVSHGIESPDVRMAKGKSPDGRLTLRAAASGDRVAIEIEDDGAGIDGALITQRAVERGLIAADAELQPAALLDILSASGFSTRDEADLASGRGVGMGVVRATVRELGGDMSIETQPGRGTCFRVELPLTLLIVDALLLEVAGEVMAMPQPVLREVFMLEPGAVTVFERNEVIAYREGVLPLLRLRRLFGCGESPSPKAAVLVVGTEAQPVGLVADRLIGLREIVVQPVTDPLLAVPGIGGATDLGDGRVRLVLDAAALVRLGRHGNGGYQARLQSAGSSPTFEVAEA